MFLKIPAWLEIWLSRFHRLLCPSWRWMLLMLASALIFQAEYLYLPTVGTKPAGLSLQVMVYGLLAFALLWLASRPHMPHWLQTLWQRLPLFVRLPAWRYLITVYIILMCFNIAVGKLTGESVIGYYRIDAVAYAHIDGDLLAHGRNPFTADDAFWKAAKRWPQALTTPLMGKAFGQNPLKYPSDKAIGNALFWQTAHPQARNDAFDTATVHNYPAGIIWLEVPLIIAGIPSMIWLSLLAWIAAMALVLARAPTYARLPLLLALIASPTVYRTVIANFDIVSIVFVLAAWHWMARERVSGLALGIACAIKQIAWFFVPFYLIEIVRREGWRAALRRSGWMALAFLLPNLPFIIDSPSAWLHSVWVPLVDPMFPMGIGAISLGFSGLVPMFPAHVWTGIEVGTIIVLLLFQWRRARVTSDGLILALVPLWFSWRSPLNYFAWIPLLAAWVAAAHLSSQAMQQRLALMKTATTDDDRRERQQQEALAYNRLVDVTRAKNLPEIVGSLSQPSLAKEVIHTQREEPDPGRAVSIAGAQRKK